MIIFGSIPNPLFSNFHSQNPKPSYFSKMVSELHGWSSPPSSCHKTLFPVIFDPPSFLLTHSIISHLWRLAKMEKQSVPFLPLRATRSITAKNEKPSAKLQWTPNALIFGSIYSSSQNPDPLVQSNKDSIDFKKPQSRDADKVLHPSHLKIPATTTTMSAPKAVVAMIRLVVPAGGARPTPPVRPALNLMAFCKDFNARTQKYKPDLPMAVTITAFKDKKVEQDSQQLQIGPTCATISRMYQALGVVFSISAAFLVIRAPRRSVESAFKVFETMPERNLVTWNSMMYVCSEPRVATMILSVPYNEFLSRIKSNQVRKVEVDGVHIMFKLKSGVGTSHDGEVSRTSSRLQESESLVKSVSPTRRIVYTTTRPSDIRTPYEKMVDNGVEFGCPNRRFVGFFNSALIALFYVDVLAGLLHRFLVSFSHHTAGQIRNHKSGTSNRYWFQVDIG